MRVGVHAPTYRSWQMMKNRCLNPNATDYSRYGARGITIDPAWLEYDSFLAAMGERPEGLTLERKDNNGPYIQSNCHWATRKEQARNREFIKRYTHEGKTLTVWEWAEKIGIKPMSFHLRLWRFKRGEISYDQLFKQPR